MAPQYSYPTGSDPIARAILRDHKEFQGFTAVVTYQNIRLGI